MSKKDKLLSSVMSGKKDKNILFTDLCRLLNFLGLDYRISGSHHIFYKENIIEILNIQPDGKLSKPYQVKQVREFILEYGLGGKDE